MDRSVIDKNKRNTILGTALAGALVATSSHAEASSSADKIKHIERSLDITSDTSSSVEYYVASYFNERKYHSSGAVWAWTGNQSSENAGKSVLAKGLIYNALGEEFKIVTDENTIHVSKLGVPFSHTNAENTDIIQGAIDTFSTVVLDWEGTREIDQVIIEKPLVISKAGFTLRGLGKERTILKKNNDVTASIGYIDDETDVPQNFDVNAVIIITNGSGSVNRDITIEDLFIKGDKREGYVDGIFARSIAYSKFENIQILHGRVGWNMGIIYMSKIFGLNIHEQHICFTIHKTSTSCDFSHCYAHSSNQGYVFSLTDYSTLTACGADTIAEGRWAYQFSDCSMTLNGCGSEDCKGGILQLIGSNVTLNGFTFFDDAQIGVTNTVICTEKSYLSVIGGQINSSGASSSGLFEIEDRSKLWVLGLQDMDNNKFRINTDSSSTATVV